MASSLKGVIAGAREDAVSLTGFMTQTAKQMVSRRLSGDIHTLDHYLEFLDGLKKVYTQKTGAVDVGGVQVKAITQAVNDAIDASAIEGNLVTDTLVTTAPTIIGQQVRTQAQKNKDRISLNDFVSASDAGTNVATKLQAAIDYAKNNEFVHIDGSYKLDSSVLVKTGGLIGGSRGYNTRRSFEITAPIRQGWNSDVYPRVGTEENGGWYVTLENIAITNNNPAQPSIINNESHQARYDGVSMRGALNAGVPHLKLGGTLYTTVRDCDFGGSGDGISAKESNYDVAYYGTNASWFYNNNFNVKGTAFACHGIFSCRDSTIEADVTGKPKVIIGETGQSVSPKTIFDNVYFECAVRVAGNRAPLIEVASPSSPNITNCHFFLSDSATNKTTSDGSPALTAVKCTHYQVGSSFFNNNVLRLIPKNSSTNLADMPVGFDLKESVDSYHELVGNYWQGYAGLLSDGQTYGYEKMYVIGNKALKDLKAPKSGERASFYIRDQLHGIVKQRLPERNIWIDFSRAAEAEPLQLSHGKNIYLTHVPVEPLKIYQPEKRGGTEFRIFFKNETLLKHATTHFRLSAKKDVTVPAGTIVEFVVGFDDLVYEIGTVTSQIETNRTKPSKGTTADRPAAPALGQVYYDTTLLASGKPITWNGASWVDALGVTV